MRPGSWSLKQGEGTTQGIFLIASHQRDNSVVEFRRRLTGKGGGPGRLPPAIEVSNEIGHRAKGWSGEDHRR
jgi:hypothetical protein